MDARFKHTSLEPALTLLVHSMPRRQGMGHHAPRRPRADNPRNGTWGTMPGQTTLGPTDARRALGSVSSAWRGVAWPAPMVMADSWFGDSKLLQHVDREY